MTTPVQEPNSYRDLQNLQWGRDQLFRRPRPPQNTFSTIRLANDSYQVTVPDNNDQALDFDSWEINDPDVFDVTTSSGRARFINLMQIGMYAITCRVTWEEGAGAIGEPDLTTIMMADDYLNNDKVTFGQTNDGNAAFVYSIVRSYPIYLNSDITETGTPPYATIQFRVNQSSPGAISQDTKQFAETSAEIWYFNMPYDFTPTYPP